MKKLLGTLTFFICIISIVNTRAQTIITSIPDITSCPNRTITVPVIVENVATVSQITLHLNYNILNGTSAPGVLTYLNFQNMHPALNNGMVVSNVGNTITMSWWAPNYIYIAHDTLLELRFFYNSGDTDLDWVLGGVSKYWGYGCGTLPSTFINGSVYQSGYSPSIMAHPVDSTSFTGEECRFSVSASNVLSYSWQYYKNGSGWLTLADTGVFSGTGTAELIISEVEMYLNDSYYRCRISGTCPPSIYSNYALLTVIPVVRVGVGGFNSCPGSVVVPVNIEDFIGISQFSLELVYDNSILSYDNHQNANMALYPGVLNVSDNLGNITITWLSSQPGTIYEGTLLELRFNSVIGDTSCLLSWNTSSPGACEFINNQGNVVASQFSAGDVGIVVCSDLTGTVYYDNILASELANVTVFLNKGGSMVDSTLTDASGHYSFSDIHNDTYIICARREGVWDGVNSADAMVIARHFVGLDTLTGLRLLAAEVDTSGYVNTSDALAVAQRFVGLINCFSNGDMVFLQDTVSLIGTNTVNVDIPALFCGDANASYVPYQLNIFLPSGILPKPERTEVRKSAIKSPGTKY